MMSTPSAPARALRASADRLLTAVMLGGLLALLLAVAVTL